MKKNKLAAVFLSALIAVNCLSGCTQPTADAKSSELDLDYIVNEEEDSRAQEEKPWYEWIKSAFKFGSSGQAESKKADPKKEADSVAEFYEKGNEEYKPLNETDNEEEEPEKDEEEKKGEKPNKKTEVKQDSVKPEKNEEEKKPAQENKKEEAKNEKEETPKKDTVTMHIRCDTAVNNGMHLESKWAGIVPASGCILDTTTFEIKDGDTAFDVLCKARDKYKIHMEYSGAGSGIYVEGINNLYEFDGGRWSGWMYSVNGWYPNYGCGAYYVKPGDVIEWNYTCDLGCDLENGDPNGYGKDWKDNHD